MHLFSSALHAVTVTKSPAIVDDPTLQEKPLPPPPVAGVGIEKGVGAGVGVVPPPPVPAVEPTVLQLAVEHSLHWKSETPV